MSAHPSHASWPHRKLHRGPHCQGPHAATSPFRHTRHTFRGPIGSSAENPSGRARMPPLRHFCTPITRFVAP
eukprot:5721522-Pyramimonas_sp.AAC.1